VSNPDTQLPRGALYLSFGQGVFVLSGYVLHMILGRQLAPSLFGVFGVTMTVLGWLEITVNNGVPVALQRFLPDRSLSEASILRAAARSQALISVAVFVLVFLAAPWLAALLRDASLTGYLRLAFVDILVMGAYAYYRGVLNGRRVFRQLSVTIMTYSLTKLAAITALVYLGFGVQGALVGNVVSSFGGLAIGYYWTRRHWGRAEPRAAASNPPDASESLGGVDERQVLAFVLPAALFTLASNVLLGLDLMGVKALLSDANQVGYYSAAVKLAEAPRLVLLAFSFTLLPSLSHAISDQDWPRTRHFLQQVVRLLALVLLPILAVVTATADGLIRLTFSDAYQPAAPILKVLICTYAVYSVYITLVTTLLAQNRPGRAMAIPLLLLPVAMGAVWLGVSRLGAMGAALASLAVVSIAAAVVVSYVLWHFKPAVGARSLACIAVASAVVWGLARLWSPSGLVLALAYGLLGIVYLGILLILREIRVEDIVLVASWLPLPGRKRGA
jgi:O-antigen/teichoic acid export membrane protein